jgi:hypothetical protein
LLFKYNKYNAKTTHKAEVNVNTYFLQ